jgi:hypothetical protein
MMPKTSSKGGGAVSSILPIRGVFESQRGKERQVGKKNCRVLNVGIGMPMTKHS